MFYIYKTSNHKTYQEVILFTGFFENITDADIAFLTHTKSSKIPQNVVVEFKNGFVLNDLHVGLSCMQVVNFSRIFPRKC